ncbi:hypothetical protein A3Q56_03380 [Intoshia linei]|uniref:Serpin domain-containing protein n=1 Tax=Intoshia linei TaxID=1819745 RepID=A0A177B3M6_9BILA|nr:hypothetical protein A3Q56_03380 [Intoshia linei]
MRKLVLLIYCLISVNCDWPKCQEILEQLKKGDLYDDLMQRQVFANPQQNAIFIPALQNPLLIMVYVTMFGESNLTRYRNFYPYVAMVRDLSHYANRNDNIYNSEQIFTHLNSFFYTDMDRGQYQTISWLQIFNYIHKLKRKIFKAMTGKLSQYDTEDKIAQFCKMRTYSHCQNYKYNEPNFLSLSNMNMYRSFQYNLVYFEENAKFHTHNGVTMLHIVNQMSYYVDENVAIVQLTSKVLKEGKILIIQPKLSQFVFDTRNILTQFDEHNNSDNITLVLPEIHNFQFQADFKQKFESMDLGSIFLHNNRPIGFLQKPGAYRDITNYDYQVEMSMTRTSWNVEAAITMSDSLTTPKKVRTKVDQKKKNRKDKKRRKGQKGKKSRKGKKNRKGIKKKKRKNKNKNKRNRKGDSNSRTSRSIEFSELSQDTSRTKKDTISQYTNQTLTQIKITMDKPFYIVIYQDLKRYVMPKLFLQCPNSQELEQLERYPVLMSAYITNPGIADSLRPMKDAN